MRRAHKNTIAVGLLLFGLLLVVAVWLGLAGVARGAEPKSIGLLDWEGGPCWPAEVGGAVLLGRMMTPAKPLVGAVSGGIWEFWSGPTGWVIAVTGINFRGIYVRCLVDWSAPSGDPL